ncbi:MAG: SpoIIE family protein phosphatase, partial [Telluria sp.]
EFDVYSAEDQGTVLMMNIWSDGVCAPAHEWQVGAVCLPVAGEDLCGDAWNMGLSEHGVTICTADGLGHGPDAARASDPAVAFASERPDFSATSLMALAHEALRGTRGAALAITVIDEQKGQLGFVGIGNIAGCIFMDGTRRHLMSHNGIVGSNLRKVQEFVHDWHSGAMVILHSDGIATRWDLENYAGLIFRHPSLIAAVLYRDFARKRDDAMVLVVRQRDDQR